MAASVLLVTLVAALGVSNWEPDDRSSPLTGNPTLELDDSPQEFVTNLQVAVLSGGFVPVSVFSWFVGIEEVRALRTAGSVFPRTTRDRSPPAI